MTAKAGLIDTYSVAIFQGLPRWSLPGDPSSHRGQSYITDTVLLHAPIAATRLTVIAYLNPALIEVRCRAHSWAVIYAGVIGEESVKILEKCAGNINQFRYTGGVERCLFFRRWIAALLDA